ncbi:MAG TPA: extracellular solute-binding protein [Gaiellaceae bacterium]|nr:extracellular solute-binding protein [Gaiellaceae bacterium]
MKVEAVLTSGLRTARALAAIACTGLVAAVLTGCGGSANGKTITIYSGQHQQTTALLVADFERRTGIKALVRPGDEAELANQIIQEGKHSVADIFYTENSPALTALAERGLLARVDSSTLAVPPSADNSPAGDWVAVSARASVMVYNTNEISASQLPAHLLDFESPFWKGKIGYAPGETDFQPLVTAIVKLKGEAAAVDWLKALKQNGKTYDDNESLVAAVNRGDVAVGLIDHYYWYRLRDELGVSHMHSELAYFAAGDPGDLVDVSGAAALKASHHPELAQRFLAYLVSEPAQKIIATSHSYEYPLRAGVDDQRLQRSLASLHAAPVSVADLGDGAKSLQLLEKLGLL